MPDRPTFERRDQVADAAVSVLAERGARALTHRAVDAAAGVPAGSTSNYFRTREALIQAVVDRLEQRDRELGEELSADRAPATLEEVAVLVARFAELLTSGQRAACTRARFELATVVDLGPAHHRLVGQLAAILSQVDAADPHRSARAVADYLDGLTLHVLTIPGRAVHPDEVSAAAYALISAPGTT
ncbi:TetR family transcriptional regulator [Naumannella sp. ID2617S]|nr:TetR family transcriptional regulator [Naumannella sp. ID2617S]